MPGCTTRRSTRAVQLERQRLVEGEFGAELGRALLNVATSSSGHASNDCFAIWIGSIKSQGLPVDGIEETRRMLKHGDQHHQVEERARLRARREGARAAQPGEYGHATCALVSDFAHDCGGRTCVRRGIGC